MSQLRFNPKANVPPPGPESDSNNPPPSLLNEGGYSNNARPPRQGAGGLGSPLAQSRGIINLPNGEEGAGGMDLFRFETQGKGKGGGGRGSCVCVGGVLPGVLSGGGDACHVMSVT